MTQLPKAPPHPSRPPTPWEVFRDFSFKLKGFFFLLPFYALSLEGQRSTPSGPVPVCTPLQRVSKGPTRHSFCLCETMCMRVCGQPFGRLGYVWRCTDSFGSVGTCLFCLCVLACARARECDLCLWCGLACALLSLCAPARMPRLFNLSDEVALGACLGRSRLYARLWAWVYKIREYASNNVFGGETTVASREAGRPASPRPPAGSVLS